MNKPKIYIAGPISNNPHYKRTFARAEEELRQEGWEPVNPANNTADTYKAYIDKGLDQLRECDAIFVLNDWIRSKGATLERRYAETVGIPSFYQVYGVPNVARLKG